MNIFKKIFKKAQGKKKTITIKTSKLDFIGKSQSIDILSEQEIDNKIQNSLGNNIARTNVDNTFTGTQTFEFAKVERVPGNHQHEVINWGVFNTRATRIEDRINNLQQELNRVKTNLQQQTSNLASFIVDTNNRFEKIKIPKTITTPESSLENLISNDIESYSVGNGVWNFKIVNIKTVTFSGSALYNELASKYEADRNTPIKIRVGSFASVFVVDRNNFRVPVGTAEVRVSGTYPIELRKNSGPITVAIQNARGIATGDPKTVLRSIMCYCVFFRTLG